ncbi:MAG: bifunctional UDP-N-acetylglucosamine diphosphorylase/glucosamine-1-phosphate N-acetyltransferase GlmU [Chloroflexi bacterium]|nr:bifunctional UDP-N-acetylglucosamine diphosphorylase/glucosamine-1-phosphate N-acetyltransferase GlmU [Chloroflexota bacterium]
MATSTRAVGSWCGVVLAAGMGVRMKSTRPKVLHPVCGLPMLAHATRALRNAGISRIVVVVPAGSERSLEFRSAAGAGAKLVAQESPRGTADALLAARPACGAARKILLTYADVPLVRPETMRQMVDAHVKSGSAITMLTARVDDPQGLGRVIRGQDGSVTAVVEEKDANPATLAVNEINSGCYAFDARWIWATLPRIQRSRSGEFYLTDAVAYTIDAGRPVAAMAAADAREVAGVNDRLQLAQAEAVMRRRILERLMASGVSVVDPSTTYVDIQVEIGQDTVIAPNTHLRGSTRIGQACEIGPNAILTDVAVGDGSRVIASFAESASIGARVNVGPFSRIRPGTVIDDDVYIGNFAEIKNSHVGSGTHIGHFSYTGDATLGRRVNIGAGAVTCNFDGKAKHATIIGDDASIGSDTMLVAPIRVGARAKTGAGAVATKDIPPGVTVVGVPAKPLVPAADHDGQGPDARRDVRRKVRKTAR